MKVTLDRLQTIKAFPELIEKRDRTYLEAAMRAMSNHKCWREAIEQLQLGSSPNVELGNALLDFWFTYGKLSIPRGLKGDLPVLLDAFKHLWPPYAGMGLTLYRGEIYSRHKKRTYGIAWTPRIECAKIFVIHQSTPKRPGVLLKLEATPEMIVAAVKEHSDHTLTLEEDEYLVDPRRIADKVVTIPNDSVSTDLHIPNRW